MAGENKQGSRLPMQNTTDRVASILLCQSPPCATRSKIYERWAGDNMDGPCQASPQLGDGTRSSESQLRSKAAAAAHPERPCRPATMMRCQGRSRARQSDDWLLCRASCDRSMFATLFSISSPYYSWGRHCFDRRMRRPFFLFFSLAFVRASAVCGHGGMGG